MTPLMKINSSYIFLSCESVLQEDCNKNETQCLVKLHNCFLTLLICETTPMFNSFSLTKLQNGVVEYFHWPFKIAKIQNSLCSIYETTLHSMLQLLIIAPQWVVIIAH